MMDFYRDGDVVVILPARLAGKRGLEVASDEQVGAAHRATVLRQVAAPAAPGPKQRRACPCSGPPIVRWLGIDWIGEPWPLRLRLRWPVHARPSRGCGCVERLKRWTEARRLARFAMRKNRESAT